MAAGWLKKKGKEDSQERRKVLIPARRAAALAFSGTTRLTTYGTPLGSKVPIGGLTLVGGWLRSLEAGHVAVGAGDGGGEVSQGMSWPAEVPMGRSRWPRGSYRARKVSTGPLQRSHSLAM